MLSKYELLNLIKRYKKLKRKVTDRLTVLEIYTNGGIMKNIFVHPRDVHRMTLMSTACSMLNLKIHILIADDAKDISL